MIVNTAYIYMGSGGAPVNPNLWQDGVANYPVVFTKDSSISSKGVTLTNRGGAATFSEIPLTGFNSLTISRTEEDFIPFINFNITIEFLNNSDDLLGTETATFKHGVNTNTVSIPGSAKIQKAKIRMTNNNNNSSITFVSALLS